MENLVYNLPTTLTSGRQAGRQAVLNPDHPYLPKATKCYVNIIVHFKAVLEQKIP